MLGCYVGGENVTLGLCLCSKHFIHSFTSAYSEELTPSPIYLVVLSHSKHKNVCWMNGSHPDSFFTVMYIITYFKNFIVWEFHKWMSLKVCLSLYARLFLSASIYVHPLCQVPYGPEESVDFLALELELLCMRGSGNWTPVITKSRRCSWISETSL